MTDSSPIDVPKTWIRRSHSDLQLGEVAFKTPGVLLEDACFHAQQCSEKALKGLLSHLKIPFPRTHDIGVLFDLLINAGLVVPKSIVDAFVLTQYAIQTRYPGEWEPVGREEAEKALLLSANVLKWVEEQLHI